jgi:hypothetical protein
VIHSFSIARNGLFSGNCQSREDFLGDAARDTATVPVAITAVEPNKKWRLDTDMT